MEEQSIDGGLGIWTRVPQDGRYRQIYSAIGFLNFASTAISLLTIDFFSQLPHTT